MRPYATIGGLEAQPMRVKASATGPWYATAELVGPAPLSGMVDVHLGALELRGTVRTHGAWALRGGVLVVGGADGWSSTVQARHYHSDAGVRADLVARDLARDVGETMGDCTPGRERVGADYVRARGPAARALVLAIAGAGWWVDYDGTTQVGSRPRAEVVGSYEVLSADPRSGTAVVACDDFGRIRIGSILRERLPAPLVVWSVDMVVAGGEVRAHVWGGAL